ncbi:uncharacterized protein [Macrobrachium rosenbergii]|uniref:uncharacterized protein n=1 Tax=Macrobrachium rosenbergii TaxID=79674 RepID=UPI0034D4C48E
MAHTGSGSGRGGGRCSSCSYGEGGPAGSNPAFGDRFVSTPDQNHPPYPLATDTFQSSPTHQALPTVQGGGGQGGPAGEEMVYPAPQGQKGVPHQWHHSRLFESEEYQTLLQSTSSLTISTQPGNQWNVAHPSSATGTKSDSVYRPSSSGIHSYQHEDSGYNPQGPMYFQSNSYGASSSKPMHQKMHRECDGLMAAAPLQAPVMSLPPHYDHYSQQVQGHHYPQSMSHSFPTGATQHVQQMNMSQSQPTTSYYHPTSSPYQGPAPQDESQYPLQPASSQYMGYHEPKSYSFRGDLVRSPEAPPEAIYNFPSDSTDDDDDEEVVLSGSVRGSEISQRADTSPDSTQKNQEELQRYHMIRHQNNLASCRYRQRKSENINRNKQKLITLQAENARLTAKVAGLQQLRDEMEKFCQNFYKTHVHK